MRPHKTAVIGGGASGMMAAIQASRTGAEVTLYEKNDRVGKKIPATGNGKCNLSNRNFSAEDYYGEHTELLPGFFARFGPEDTIRFFHSLGMLTRERNGYLYPYSGQASTVLETLRRELGRSRVTVVTGRKVTAVVSSGIRSGGGLLIHTGTDKQTYDTAVLACGGSAAPGTGSDGSGILLAEALGHRIVPVVPALVQLRCADKCLKTAAGVRCEAGLTLKADNRIIGEEKGELQITDYGISGIPVFQFSRTAAYALRDGAKVTVTIDFFPDYEKDIYREAVEERMAGLQAGNRPGDRYGSSNGCGRDGGRSREEGLEEFLEGFAHSKVNRMVLRRAGFRSDTLAGTLTGEEWRRLYLLYRRFPVNITAANSFGQAQVSAGGIDLSQADGQLQSRLVPGLYFAGEILDVDGRCGGYNLQWAWTSGAIAGAAAGIQA